MKTDRYTKIVLTLIAIFLGFLALGRAAGPSTASAQPRLPAAAFVNVDLVPAGTTGFFMFDRNTGGVWFYTLEGQPGGWHFGRLGPGGRIERPGSDAQRLP